MWIRCVILKPLKWYMGFEGLSQYDTITIMHVRTYSLSLTNYIIYAIYVPTLIHTPLLTSYMCSLSTSWRGFTTTLTDVKLGQFSL